MKKYFVLIMIFCTTLSYSQERLSGDNAEIQHIVDQFFVALETQDTSLFNTMLYKNAQVWVVRKKDGKLMNTVSTFGKDLWSLNPKYIIREKALGYDIKIHNEIATAWVPYDIYINDKLIHCGIDAFTFLKSEDGWKIVNCSYSAEPDGCDAIKEKLGK